MSERRYDAVVVGGGAVGAATAAALAQAGVLTALIEKGEAPASFDPRNYDLRVYALSPGSVRFLRALGIWERILTARACAYESMRVWEDEAVHALHFDAAEAGVPHLGYIVENKLLLSALWSRLEAVSIFEKAQIARWQYDDGGAHLRLRDGRELETRLVIAADGADSVLRGEAGIDCATWPYPQQAIVCHVQTERPHHHSAYQRFLPTGPLAFLPLADGRCSIVWSSSEAWRLLTLEDREFMDALTQAGQRVLGAVSACTPRVAYPLRLLHAEKYVRERFALVGDAAHVIHPLAGQGVNLGIADAQALAEVLGEAKADGRDLGHLRVLQRYERARRADNLDMLALTEGLYRIFSPGAEPLKPLRRSGMEAVQRLRPLKDFFVRRAMQA